MKKILIILAFLISCTIAEAQEDVGCGPFDENCGEDPPQDQIPVDGGIGLLLVTGTILGLKKIRNIQ